MQFLAQKARGRPTPSPTDPLTSAPDGRQNIQQLTPENFEPEDPLARALIHWARAIEAGWDAIPKAGMDVLVGLSPCLLSRFQSICGGQTSTEN